MRSVEWRVRASGTWRFVVMLSSGVTLGGCAAMSQDVHAYYRQMAINYHEAVESAKRDETSMRNQLRILGVTNDKSGYVRAQHKLEKLRAWEEKCAKEEQRFAKAADWMESHFDIKKPKLVGKDDLGDAASDGPAVHDSKPTGMDSNDSEAVRGHTTEEPNVD